MLSQAVLGKDVAEELLTEEGVQVLGSLGSLGCAFFIFLAGVKIDHSMIPRVSKRALYTGISSVAAPLVFAALILMRLDIDDNTKKRILFVSPGHVATSFPAISSLLSELRLTNSELGRVGLSSAIISDLLTIVFVIFSTIWRMAIYEGAKNAALNMFGVLVLLATGFFILRPAMKWIIRQTPEGKPVHPIFITVIILLFLLSVSINKWNNQFMFLAPYLIGLTVPHGPPLGSALVEKLESMVNNLLLPLFVTASGVRVTTLDIKKVTDFSTLIGTNALIASTIALVKFVAALLPAFYSQMPTNDCFALACIMSYKGVVEIAIFTILFDQKVRILIKILILCNLNSRKTICYRTYICRYWVGKCTHF